MQLVIIQLYPSSYHFHPVRSNIPLSILFSEIICLFSSVRVSDQASSSHQPSPNGTVSHPRRLATSVSLLWELQTPHHWLLCITLTSHEHPGCNYSYVKSTTLPARQRNARCSSEPRENGASSTPYNAWGEKTIWVVQMCQYNAHCCGRERYRTGCKVCQ